LRFAVAAQRVDRDPLSFESFDADELVLMLSDEAGQTIFCRRDDPARRLDERPRFIIGSLQFERWTEPI
jgi:hypothetical protein